MPNQIQLLAFSDFPLVEPGDDLSKLILSGLERDDLQIQSGDYLVVAQKIVSKSENRYLYLNSLEPTSEALSLALEVDKDPRLVQLILDESNAVIKHRKGVLIVEHKLGIVHANAGIDQSNIDSEPDNPRVLLLPENPDASATLLRQTLQRKTAVDPIGVIISDSAGRAWRNGITGFAIGTSGFSPIDDYVGRSDLFGGEMRVTQSAIADELAAAASLLMGQANEGVPVVLIRGAKFNTSSEGSGGLIRSREEDLFR